MRSFLNGLKLGSGSSDPLIVPGTGSPEGVVTAGPGSNYQDKNGLLWWKATGTGNTGWVLVGNLTGNLVDTTNWWFCPHTGVSTRLFTANGETLFTPMYFAQPVTIDGLAIEVTTVGSTGAVIRLGIFGMGTNGKPGALLSDAGTVSGVATGSPSITGLATKVAGWVFFAAAQQGAPTTRATIRIINGDWHVPAMNTGGSSPSTQTGAQPSYTASGITGAFAANPTVAIANVNVPRFQFKLASLP